MQQFNVCVYRYARAHGRQHTDGTRAARDSSAARDPAPARVRGACAAHNGLAEGVRTTDSHGHGARVVGAQERLVSHD